MMLLVLSDLHLSAKPDDAKVKALVSVIGGFEGNEIILNGDIVDLWHSNGLVDVIRVNKPFFDALRKHKRVTWIEGNHDEHITSFASLNNIKIVPEHTIKHRGIRYVFVHGDKFDPKIIKYYLLGKFYNRMCGVVDRTFKTNISTWFSGKFDKVIGKGRPFNASDELAIATLINTYSKDFDTIVVGHYHKPEIRKCLIGDRVVTYANSGDWVTHRSYLIIENGNIRVVSYDYR